jgi:hypothetical protein
MQNVWTFDNLLGGNTIYKALAHPLAAEAMERLRVRLRAAGPIALYDPFSQAHAFAELHNLEGLQIAGVYVQDVRQVGARSFGHTARPVTEIGASGAKIVFIAAFDSARAVAQIAHFLPANCVVLSFDDLRLPTALITNTTRYVDPLNFAVNHAFFRDEGGLSTRLVTANYWSGYGAVRRPFFWLRLFGADGQALATWQEDLPQAGGSVVIDSREIRARVGLAEFTGQLFIHVVGAAGHDIVKYALDVIGAPGRDLSCTHDANAWPADRYAGVPAPRPGERVIVWVQNSHAEPIPAGAVGLARMGDEHVTWLDRPVPGFGTLALDVASLLPDVAWPAQIEVRAGRHFVRPRYEVLCGDHRLIAHANVERMDLKPDPAIPLLANLLGRSYLLPMPILPRRQFRTEVQPTPMSIHQTTLPVRLDLFDSDGKNIAERFLGCLTRDHALAIDLDDILGDDLLVNESGHAELVYDFHAGGEADGWLHALVRCTDRTSGHAAETSFGSHVFNTVLTYKDEPQSYAGRPPGLSTRLFMRLGQTGQRSFTMLIYPASTPWHARSDTRLELHDASGAELAHERLPIACSGSALLWMDDVFGESVLRRAGEGAFVLIRDATCRLFGYHGLVDTLGAFSLDHMFGF